MTTRTPKWNLKIKNTANRAEIWIYGNIIDDADGAFAKLLELDDGYVFPAKIREQLDEIGDKPVNIYIASDGGDVNAGMAIANIIKRLKGATTAYIDSWAASIASVIALACDRVVMPENTFIMIHNPACICVGMAADMRKTADLLDTIRDSIVDTYCERCNTEIPVDVVKQYVPDFPDKNGEAEDMFMGLMDNETWLTAADCKAIWTHVEVIEATNKAVACYSGFDKAPAALHKPEPKPEPKPVDYSELIKKATEVLTNGYQ